MMRNSSRTASLSRYPRGLLGAMVLVVLIESYFVHHHDTYTTEPAESWRQTARATVEQVQGRVLLCFGDSMIKFGVLPRVAELTCGSTQNLALHAGPPSASYLLLRRALQHGATPREVVVDFMPHQLAMRPTSSDFRRLWPELASIRDCFELAWNTMDADFLAAILLAKGLPSYRSRYEVRAGILAWVRGEGYGPRRAIRALRRNWGINLGAQVMPKASDYHGEVNSAHGGLFPACWCPDQTTDGYVHRFLELAKSRGITVFWLIPPLNPGTQVRREELGLDAIYTDYVRRTQSEYSNVVVLDGRQMDLSSDVFIDMVHLDRQGATAFSTSLFRAVSQRTTSGQPAGDWLTLATDPNPLDVRLVEDVRESGFALHQSRQRVRR